MLQIIMPQYFTKQGLEKLKEELHQLKTVENKKVVKLIAEAAAFGDLKENSAYHDACDKMAFLRMRIKELESAINEAVIKEKTGNDKIEVGSEVVILFGNKKQRYKIVAPVEANILENKISYQSPLGQKLMGQKVGKEFNFTGGVKSVRIKILQIN
jgi:transcription elongation factor GreA